MQKHLLFPEQIHGELAWEHEAAKLEAIQSKMRTKPPETHCRRQLSRHDSLR